jgi:transmembrane sensor
MSELRVPLRDVLGDGTSEEEVQRIWTGVQQRRARSAAAPHKKAFWIAGVLGAVAMAMLLVVSLVGMREFAPGALLTRDGRAPATIGADQPVALEFTDGSRLELGPGAELEVLENNGHALVSALRRGRVGFQVQPGGPRRWTIEAGLATVEVVGTRFILNRTAAALEIDVERGIVLVRGERVRDRVQRLEADQRLVVSDGSTLPAVVESRGPAAEAADRAEPPSSEGISSSAPATNVPAQHGRAGASSIDELLLLADARRRSGDLAGAETLLRRAIALHTGNSRAALAAFTLGRLLFDDRPREAAQAFGQCLALSPPAALAEDALARLAEAEARGGRLAQARRAADEYQRRYPHGRWLAAVKQWADLD